MSTSPITLVTGASRGLGLETARQLTALGHTVLVSARSLADAERVAGELGGLSEAIELDVERPEHHARVARTIEARHGRLDVLVNNAGAILGEPWVGNTATTVSPEVLRKTFAINLFAVVELTQALVPLLRKGRSARVVNVSSVMGSTTVHADPTGPLWGNKPFAYDASKSALNAFTVHLAQALAADGILVNSAHPGWVKTALGGDWAPMSVEDGARTIVELATLPDGGPTASFRHRGDSVPW